MPSLLVAAKGLIGIDAGATAGGIVAGLSVSAGIQLSAPSDLDGIALDYQQDRWALIEENFKDWGLW